MMDWSLQRRMAQARVRTVVADMGDIGDLIWNGFKVTDQIHTACWATRERDLQSVILISERLAATLPDDELRALITHELYHAVGANGQFHFHSSTTSNTADDSHSGEPLIRHTAQNLALDVALEQAMGFGQSAVRFTLERLRDRLILEELRSERSKRTISLAKAIPVLTCPKYFGVRLPSDVKRIHQFLHHRLKPILPEAAYQAVLPLLRKLNAKTPGGLPRPEVVRIPSTDGSPDEVFHVRTLPSEVSNQASKDISLGDFSANFERLLLSLKSSLSLRRIILPPQKESQSSLRRLRRYLTHELVQFLSTGEPERNRCRDTVIMLPWIQRPTNHEIRSLAMLPSSIPRLHENVLKTPAGTSKPDVAVFIDASSSMRTVSDAVHSVLQQIVDLLPDLPGKIWAFDGSISPEPLTRQMIRDGMIYTGSWTNFDATVEFAILKRLRQILLFTDGGGRFSVETLRDARAHRISIHGVIFGNEDMVFPSSSNAGWTTRFIWPG